MYCIVFYCVYCQNHYSINERHSSGLLQAFFRPSSGFLQAFFRPSSGLLQAAFFRPPSSGRLQAFFRPPSGRFQAFFRPSSGRLQAVFRPQMISWTNQFASLLRLLLLNDFILWVSSEPKHFPCTKKIPSSASTKFFLLISCWSTIV